MSSMHFKYIAYKGGHRPGNLSSVQIHFKIKFNKLHIVKTQQIFLK